jgi:hypothetical protein
MLKTLSLVVLLGIAVAAPMNAQDTAARNQRGRATGRAADPGAAGEFRAADVMRVLDGYALVQAQETLQLSDEQYASFVTRLKKLQETRRTNQQGRQRILQELRRLAGPQAAQAAQSDDNAIRQQIKSLRDHEERTAVEVRKAYDALDEVLDAKQQARFRLFEERLELRKMDLLMRARQGAARRENR